MALLTTGKGKKDEIERLIEVGKSDDEITKIVDTSKSYVQKVKSQSKSTKGKTAASDIEQDELVDEKRVLEINKETTILPEHKPSSLERKELTKNERRKIYALFFKGWTPSKIVAKIGYPYEVLDAEYRNYNKDTGLDMQTFQEEFMHLNSECIKDIGPKGEKFVKKYKKNGCLLNEDISELIQLIWDTYEERAINNVLHGKISPPEGWTEINCYVCEKPLHGALVDSNDEVGKYCIDVCDEAAWKHGDCHEKEEVAKAKTGLDELINTGT